MFNYEESRPGASLQRSRSTSTARNAVPFDKLRFKSARHLVNVGDDGLRAMRHDCVRRVREPEESVFVVAAENQRGPQSFEEIQATVNVRLNRLRFVIRSARSGAKRCRVAKVSKMHARFRLVIFAKFDDGLDGSRVGVDSMRATNGEQPFPFSRDAWSFHKEFPAINFLASTNNVGSSLVGLKIFATG